MKRSAMLAVCCLAAAVAWAGSPVPLPQAPHSALDAMGPQAADIVRLWRVFVVTCSVVFGAILAVLLWVLWRTPRATERAPADLSSTVVPEARTRRNVVRAVLASTLLLVMLIVASVFTDRSLARMPLADALTLEVTAHQWWWTVRYLQGSPSETVETANEIHVPVGRPVVVKLQSDDVIHSLWVPNLAGKKDLIPGRTALMQFQADRPGVYRGQCAEFCGYQHARMGLVVIAEPGEQFQAWLQAQRAPAAEPGEPQAQRGKQLFQALSCALCHTVQGTLAQGRRAPDLTHLGSRLTLASGTLDNTPQHLASWIADPQKHKPGTNMPATPMSQDDLQAIVAYLGTLK
jgi:cytochrome c oxidase subunit 2